MSAFEAGITFYKGELIQQRGQAMEAMKGLIVVAFALGAVGGCGDDKFSDCALGELTGTWRVTYDQIDGNCGPIASETVVASSAAPQDPSCTTYTNTISEDKCRQDIDIECPTLDGLGTQRWVMVLEHVKEDLITGTATVQAEHSTYGYCRGTYDIEMKKL